MLVNLQKCTDFAQTLRELFICSVFVLRSDLVHMKLMTLVTILLFCLCAKPALGQSSERIVMWVGEYPPYTSSKEKDGGPLVQLVSRALEMLTLESTLKYSSWSDIPQRLEIGSAISYPYTKSSERLSKFLYSDLLLSVRSHFFTYGERPSSLYKNKVYWNGKTHCRPRGWEMENFETRYKDFDFRQVRPETLEECFELMKSGKVDLVQMTDPVVWDLLRKNHPKNEGFRTLEDGDTTNEFFVIVSKRNPKARAILDSFNKGLQQLKTSGQYRRLLEQTKLLAPETTSTQGGRKK